MRLVQGDALTPAVLQGRGLVVGGEDPLQVGAAEDGEGREVLLGVPALRGGVDEDGAARGPHDVAAPQVAVGARRADVLLAGDCLVDEARLAVVEAAGVEALAQPLDEGALGGGEGSIVDVGGDALARVEAAPGFARGRGRGGLVGVRAVRAARFAASARATRQGQGRLAHPAVARVPVGGGAQVGGSGGVRVGEGPTELLGRPWGWGHGDQARLLEPCRAVIEDGDDGRAGRRSLCKPREARDLVGDPPPAAVRLPHRVHGRSPVAFPRPARGAATALPHAIAHLATRPPRRILSGCPGLVPPWTHTEQTSIYCL